MQEQTDKISFSSINGCIGRDITVWLSFSDIGKFSGFSSKYLKASCLYRGMG
jgi:hypothetical protein